MINNPGLPVMLSLLLLIIFPTVLRAADPILVKNGVCPAGYHTEGSYCVAHRDNAPVAIPKTGVCPAGYHTEGHYCVANHADAATAIPKTGVCPSGYHTEGGYCVSNQR